jgi:hypothetical protein
MLVAVMVAAVLAQAAAPQTPPTQAPAAAAPAKPEKPKVVCHDESDTGSFISHRVCRTIGKAEAGEAQSRREADALADHIAACHGQPSC